MVMLQSASPRATAPRPSSAPPPDFRALFEGGPGLNLALTPELTIVAVSDAYARATMTERSAILGRDLLELFPGDAEDGAAEVARRLQGSFERVLTSGRADFVAAEKYRIRRPLSQGGGFEERYWSFLNTPVLDDSGRVAWIIHRVQDMTPHIGVEAAYGRLSREQRETVEHLRCVNRALAAEINERKAVEERLRQSQKMEALGQLTSGITHDFNNLLLVLLANLERLRQEIAEEDGGRELIDDSVDAVMHGTALTKRLLAFARRQAPHSEVRSINELVVRFVGLARRALGEQIAVTTALAAEAWSARVDAEQLDNALLNLSLNGRDAMPAGGALHVTTRNIPRAEAKQALNEEAVSGDYIMIAVADNGMGMTPEIAARVFEPFFTTKQAGRGTGLGLSMVCDFVQQSAGHIRLHTTPGTGTRVEIYLPRASGADAAGA